MEPQLLPSLPSCACFRVGPRAVPAAGCTSSWSVGHAFRRLPPSARAGRAASWRRHAAGGLAAADTRPGMHAAVWPLLAAAPRTPGRARCGARQGGGEGGRSSESERAVHTCPRAVALPRLRNARCPAAPPRPRAVTCTPSRAGQPACPRLVCWSHLTCASKNLSSTAGMARWEGLMKKTEEDINQGSLQLVALRHHLCHGHPPTTVPAHTYAQPGWANHHRARLHQHWFPPPTCTCRARSTLNPPSHHS